MTKMSIAPALTLLLVLLTIGTTIVDCSQTAGSFRGSIPAGSRKLQATLLVAHNDTYETIQDENLEVEAPGLLANDTLVANPSAILFVSSHLPLGNFQGELELWPDGKFEYNPDNGFIGTERFNYTVCQLADINACNDATATIHVIRDPNMPDVVPTAVDDEYTVMEGETLKFDSQDDGGFLDNDETGTPYNRLFACEIDGDSSDDTENDLDVDDDGSFEYEAERCWTGTESFTYQACYEDYPDMISNEAKVIIKVTKDPNRPDTPKLDDDSYELWEATTLIVPSGDHQSLLWNDIGGDALYVNDYEKEDDFEGDLNNVEDDGSFEYTAESGMLGEFKFTYEVCIDGWECLGCEQATVTLKVTPNPNKPDTPPITAAQTVTVTEGERHRGNVFDSVTKDARYNIEATEYQKSSGFVGTLNTEDDGSFEYGNAPVGTESFSYTVCYVEWPDLCSTGSVTMVTEAVEPSSSASRSGVGTWYQVEWAGITQGCSEIKPSLTLRCNGTGELRPVSAGTNSNWLCTNTTAGQLDCAAQNSGVVHVECRDRRDTTSVDRQLIVSLESSPVVCTGTDDGTSSFASHNVKLKTWCNDTWVDRDFGYCSGTLIGGSPTGIAIQRSVGTSDQVCQASAFAIAGAAQPKNVTVTSTVDNGCIIELASVIPTAQTPTLQDVGNDLDPADKYPLQECQADCDDDSECAGELVCFQRDDSQVVPGCIGTGEDFDGLDFCIKPIRSQSRNNVLVLVGDADGKDNANYPLLECEADCDDDDECTGDLVCFHRSGSEAVPGCIGDMAEYEGRDFCIRPELAPSDP